MYGLEVVILVKIGMPTYRVEHFDPQLNLEELRLNLDLLEEKRELAALREAKYKHLIFGYYNSRVRATSFRPSDLVLRKNKASHVEGHRKKDPK